MTKREFLTAIANHSEMTDELAQYAVDALALMDEANAKRKNTANGKRNTENAPVIAALKNALTIDPQTATDLAAAVGVSTQKASALLRQMVASGDAVVSEHKVPKAGVRKFYALAATDDQ